MDTSVESWQDSHETNRLLVVSYTSIKPNWYINTAYCKYADNAEEVDKLENSEYHTFFQG